MSLFQRIKAPFTEADDAPAAAMPKPRPVGEILRERREELHLDINDIGEVLRIKPGFLAALEENRPQDLPGPTYVIGFVRAYARHLGLDHEWVLERYKTEAAGVRARPDLAFPAPLGERSLPGGPILLVALILAICGYGTWYYLSTGERARPERVAAVPPALQIPLPEPPAGPGGDAKASAPAPAADSTSATNAAASPSASAPANAPANAPAGAASNPRLSSGLLPTSAGATTSQPAAAPAPDAAPAATPIKKPPEPAAGAAAPAPQTAAAALPPASTSSPTGADSSGAANSARIEIKASADCWVQIRAPDQSIVFSRVLKTGETYRVPSRSGLVLRTGNAGALAITVDGKPAPSIGPLGTLRRNVVLDPAALAAGTAVQG